MEARSIRKTYDAGTVRVEALRGVDLVLEQGEMVAIMGPSGCGKTTLLNCLSGLDSLDGGEVVIEGTPLSEMSDRERTDYRARRMGFVFQFYNLMPVLTAVENVELPLLLARVDGANSRARARCSGRARARRPAWAARATSRMRCRAASGSGSRSRARSSTILRSCWADEPTGDLDSENAGEVVELMRRLNLERGLTFLIVTHDIAVGRKTDQDRADGRRGDPRRRARRG